MKRRDPGYGAGYGKCPTCGARGGCDCNLKPQRHGSKMRDDGKGKSPVPHPGRPRRKWGGRND